MYFVSAMLLAGIIGAATGAPGGVVIALFLVIWLGCHVAAWTLRRA